MPNINEFELEQTARVLAVVNPDVMDEEGIRATINAQWPFDNIATAGWVAYAENRKMNKNVRVALTPYSMHRFMQL